MTAIPFYDLIRYLRAKWMLIAAFLVLAAVLFFSFYNPYRGPDAIEPPVQVTLAQPDTLVYPGRQGDVELKLLAEYSISAAVKSRQEYETDYAARISPLDLVLAWGELNVPATDDHIRYSQYGRWYEIRYDAATPVSASYIQENAANVHMIPKNDRIATQLMRLRVGDYVELAGYLVQAHFETGTWTSSLTRSDTGDGACEILYVTRVSVG